MRKLSKDELSAIQDLTDSPLIEQWSIDGHSNTLRRVTVISTVNASWNGVDALLDAIFPESEYRGKAGISVVDGIISEFYSIDVDQETLINLCMKKDHNWQKEMDPALTESGCKIPQEYLITKDVESEPIGPCSIEQIISMEG